MVGALGDCCSASAGLAAGLSFATFANSRADVTKDRPWHAGRCEQSSKQDGVERAHLEAYIRDLRRSMEGPKGGSAPTAKWSIDKTSISKRWDHYKRYRVNAGQPIIGSEGLFKKIWREHTEIREISAKGHPVCNDCGARAAKRAQYEGRTDVVAMQRKRAGM